MRVVESAARASSFRDVIIVEGTIDSVVAD